MRRIISLVPPQLQASYTIEAALLVPLFLVALLSGMLLAIDCCKDVSVAAADWEQLEEIEPTAWIWRAEVLAHGMEDIFGDTISEKSEK